MKKKTMYHYWDAKTRKYYGVSRDIYRDISDGGPYVHFAFEAEVPEFPGTSGLDDGWYVWTHKNGNIFGVLEKKGDNIYWPSGNLQGEAKNYIAIKKFPQDPVDV